MAALCEERRLRSMYVWNMAFKGKWNHRKVSTIARSWNFRLRRNIAVISKGSSPKGFHDSWATDRLEGTKMVWKHVTTGHALDKKPETAVNRVKTPHIHSFYKERRSYRAKTTFRLAPSSRLRYAISERPGGTGIVLKHNLDIHWRKLEFSSRHPVACSTKTQTL